MLKKYLLLILVPLISSCTGTTAAIVKTHGPSDNPNAPINEALIPGGTVKYIAAYGDKGRNEAYALASKHCKGDYKIINEYIRSEGYSSPDYALETYEYATANLIYIDFECVE